MSTAIFVIVFVLLGLGVFFVAMGGGPGGAGRLLHSQRRGARRFAIVVFVVVLVLLGIGVPAGVIALVNDRNSIPEADVTNLTPAEKRGRELFGARCALCHTLKAANAVAQVGPNLDDLRPSRGLVLNAIQCGRARGNGNMPAQVYVGQDAQDVASFVAKATGGSMKGSSAGSCQGATS